MAEQDAHSKAPDVMELWREWLTQSERQFNAFLNEMMNTEPAARSMSNLVELYAVFQRTLGQAMERYLGLMNMPSRTDVTALGETLRLIEERLARIEETLLIAAEAVDGQRYGAQAEGPAEPARTRRPWDMEMPERPPAAAVPEPLRRT